MFVSFLRPMLVCILTGLCAALAVPVDALETLTEQARTATAWVQGR